MELNLLKDGGNSEKNYTINHPVNTSKENSFKLETILSPAIEACNQLLSIKLISSRLVAKICKVSNLRVAKDD